MKPLSHYYCKKKNSNIISSFSSLFRKPLLKVYFLIFREKNYFFVLYSTTVYVLFSTSRTIVIITGISFLNIQSEKNSIIIRSTRSVILAVTIAACLSIFWSLRWKAVQCLRMMILRIVMTARQAACTSGDY